ncbi:MAG TPA: hypothetical protein PKI32_00760 [Opitutales bacterium]|nr:hypothetical protein [Opitutales bacterium]
MNYILFILFALLAALFAAALFKVIRNVGGKADSAMKKLADKLALPVLGAGSPGGLFILDVWKGRELNIQNIPHQSGDKKVFYAAIDIPVQASKELKLSFTSVGWMTQAGIQLGQKPLSTGDESFDRQFIVKGSDPGLAAKVMTEGMRKRFREVWDERDVRGVLSLREGRIHYEEPGRLRSDIQIRRFEALAGLCSELAAEIDRCAPPEIEKTPESQS